MHYDLIVIGMGLSGLMAAKTAAESGQRVLIVGKGMGSLVLFSNTIDVLGLPPLTEPKTIKMEPHEQAPDVHPMVRRGEHPVPEGQFTHGQVSGPLGTGMRDSLSQWIKEHLEHPYSKVGLEKIEEALSSFLSLFPPPYSFQTIANMNCLLPTGAGTLRPTYLIPMTMIGGASANEGITLSSPDVLHQDMTATALARLMEKKSFRENIGWEIKKQLHGESRVGFPALLGMHDPILVKEDLEEIIGAKVFEIPILPPSIPGMRIFNRFKEWLIQKGVTFLLGYSVSKATLKGKRCERIEVRHPPVITSYSADRYILATGRFIGGGLKANDEKIFEPIFNLPLSQPPSREGWFRNSFFSDLPHPIYQSGILIDSSFRPVDEREELILENVRVAGSILAHHHSIDEKSREGIEISTGYTAAKRALGV
jgi:glycerol-3-phosphate dehydrogenase subunit B